ncbi:hypothetical protein DRY96_23355 [Salmonella enterica subsp. enterica serovar Thompson]|uniref:Uncharacterized protein n=1 Tax=Salmonella thompson TaxID=600 RepID=A0A5X5UZE9_SALTH|nr:hypothetical protein [Salmonella enterica subsp. enterica serovar Thompson]EBS6758693.1 hypothetical protein [Salmonella enterica subsp. enterica serovar Thompson]EBX4579208.1 hypothetical protein [Salmonella enterica subsp. enterica serovar Thompson]EBY5289926.1 hypothetical protein [Salmonella enterica subsp. enterica serovar Thompson]ECA2696659.1 hypothetical protein [Salmonella enterica subsp. enterica serovar Thompson]
MGIIAGIKLFTSVISYKYPALTIFIRCLQGTPLIPRKFSSCCIVFRAVPLSCCFILPLCNITGHATRSAKSRHRPVMTDDMLMWSRSGTATPR